MANITLSDGREITFDFSKLSLKEYRSLFDKDQTPEKEDEVIARVCGLTTEEYTSLSYQDWKKLLRSFFERSREPADPN